jgi:hypothetical protein
MLLRLRLRNTARRLADHGWPVTPGSYFNGERMACDRSTCWATSCHPLLPDWESNTDSSDWWNERPHAVLLTTGEVFDVIEVPGLLGAKVKGVFGPIALLPTRRWMFFVRSGSMLRPELEHRLDIVQHGAGSWVPAPPTLLAEGSVRWHLSPQQVGWTLPAATDVQQAMMAALVALDASFLDLPLNARPRVFGRPPAVETALRRAA